MGYVGSCPGDRKLYYLNLVFAGHYGPGDGQHFIGYICEGKLRVSQRADAFSQQSGSRTGIKDDIPAGGLQKIQGRLVGSVQVAVPITAIVRSSFSRHGINHSGYWFWCIPSSGMENVHEQQWE